VLLSLASRQLGPIAGQALVQADWLEGPHPQLVQAAIGTASWTLPRGSSQLHQFWAFNAALPAATQLPVRALEVLSLPALIRLAQVTQEPVPLSARSAEVLARFTDWYRAQITSDGGLSEAELAALSPDDVALLGALGRTYRGPEAYYINFYGPPGTIPSYSAADLLIPESGDVVPDDDLRGRVVFVGYQELDIPQAPDSFPTAFRSADGVDLGGVEIAATAFGNLMHEESLRALPELARLALVGSLGFALALASCLGTVWRGMALTLALGAAYAGIAVASFVLASFWLPVVVPILVLVPLAIGIGQAVHYFGAARWLGVYTPRQVSRRLLEGGDFGSRAQMREVTVMLTDIVGFTAMAEQSSPDEVTDFVNRHFTMLDRCVEAEGGTLAQFIGDSVMSFWGAPDPQPDHAARACHAALAIAAALAAENRRRAEEGVEPVRMRIGINTGMVTAGNVGAPGRSNYGIVGDTVNTTQRIEQLAKVICPDQPTAAILVSARTRELAGSAFAFHEAGAHEVRGRSQAVMIYQLLDRGRDLSASSGPTRGDRRAAEARSA
jgi:class 3 adenylate cyclase